MYTHDVETKNGLKTVAVLAMAVLTTILFSGCGGVDYDSRPTTIGVEPRTSCQTSFDIDHKDTVIPAQYKLCNDCTRKSGFWGCGEVVVPGYCNDDWEVSWYKVFSPATGKVDHFWVKNGTVVAKATSNRDNILICGIVFCKEFIPQISWCK